MIKQLICWIRTGHFNKELIESKLLPIIDDTVTTNVVCVEKVYRCKDCERYFTEVEQHD
jgi:hypothetical protein